jgi:hypothetical protein
VPPLVGVAVKIILVPEQIVVAVAPILTDGVTGEVIAMVIAFDVAVGWVTQVSEDVMTTVTTSLFARDAF